MDDLQSERNNQRVLYRAVKSRRKLNGNNSGESGGNTPTAAASGASTPVHTADIAAGSGGYEGKDAVHSMIAEKLKELQLAKQHDTTTSSSADEPSVSHGGYVSRPHRTSHPSTAFHTHNPSMDGNSLPDSNSFPLPPTTPFGTVTGALERKAWRSPSASNATDNPPTPASSSSSSSSSSSGSGGSGEMGVMPKPVGVGNVCICLDRDEGRRNSVKLGLTVGGAAGDEVMKESRRRCPIHQLPDA